MKNLNSPIKRVCFLMLLLGFATLLISLIVWSNDSRSNRIYYTKDHYRWVKVDNPVKGSEKYWQIDYKCAKNYIQSYLKQAQYRLDDLKTKEPEPVDITKVLTVSTKNKKELERNQKAYKIRNEWEKKYQQLKIEIKLIRERNYYQYSMTRAHRESEIRQRMKPLTNSFYLITKKDTRTEEEKFNDALKFQLSIFTFPKNIQNAVFQKCTRQGYLHYSFIETTTHSDIEHWVKEHWIAFWAGIVFVIIGFFGSICFSVTSGIYEITLKKLFNWIKKGDVNSQ